MLNPIALKDEPFSITEWAAFKKGDRLAFSTLFRNYYPVLFQYGNKICKDPMVLEDCIHDLFIELWHSKSKTEIKSVKAYLLNSLKYKLFKIYRQSNTLQSTDNAFENMAFEISHDDFLIQKEEENSKSSLLINAINNLPGRQKEIVYLKIFKGLEYDEISEVMNINYQAARNLFYQAMKVLRLLIQVK